MRVKQKKRSTKKNKTRKGKRKQRGGAQPIPICIYSHSSFFDVLQIQVDYLAKLFGGTDQPIYLFIDKPYDKETNLKFTTIQYDDTIPYTKRLLYCIEQINQPYIIVSHEGDILLKYDASIIQKLVEVMSTNEVDSVDLLSHRVECKDTIQVSDTLSIVRIGGNRYAYSVQPRLWKRESAKNLYSFLPGKDYKTSEDEYVQSYVSDNQKTYGICCTNPIKSFGLQVHSPNLGIHVSPIYAFLHLTGANRFVRNIKESDNVDPFIAEAQRDIHNKYIKGLPREVMN
jgi:hypothetical protein